MRGGGEEGERRREREEIVGIRDINVKVHVLYRYQLYLYGESQIFHRYTLASLYVITNCKECEQLRVL